MTARKDAAALAEQGMAYIAPGPLSTTSWVGTDHGPRVVRVDGKRTVAMDKAERRGAELLTAMAAGATPFYESGAYARGFVHVVDVPLESRERPGVWTWVKGSRAPVAPIVSESVQARVTIPFDYKEKVVTVRIWADLPVVAAVPVHAKRRYKRRAA